MSEAGAPHTGRDVDPVGVVVAPQPVPELGPSEARGDVVAVAAVVVAAAPPRQARAPRARSSAGRGSRAPTPISCGEPIIKVALGSLGSCLRSAQPPGNVCYHALITARGILDPQTANLWVHVSMYGSIVLSGACDLLCWKGLLPDRFDSVAHVAVFANVGSLRAAPDGWAPFGDVPQDPGGPALLLLAVAAADLLVPRHRWVPLTFMRVFFSSL